MPIAILMKSSVERHWRAKNLSTNHRPFCTEILDWSRSKDLGDRRNRRIFILGNEGRSGYTGTLGFYQGDIFNQDPSESDCERGFSLLEQLKPQRISLALDPEGSGPDTHYKCLLAISEALSKHVKMHPEREVEILGYRNVWKRFFPWEADAVLLLSQSQLAEIDGTFKNYYFSQVEASFPSPDYNGAFSELSIQIWEKPKKELDLLLGDNVELFKANGAIFVRILTPGELIAYALERRAATQGL